MWSCEAWPWKGTVRNCKRPAGKTLPLKLKAWQKRGTMDGQKREEKQSQSGGVKRWPSKRNQQECVTKQLPADGIALCFAFRKNTNTETADTTEVSQRGSTARIFTSPCSPPKAASVEKRRARISFCAIMEGNKRWGDYKSQQCQPKWINTPMHLLHQNNLSHLHKEVNNSSILTSAGKRFAKCCCFL